MGRITTYLPDALILLGVAILLVGVWQLFGSAWTAVVGGLLLTVYGFLVR